MKIGYRTIKTAIGTPIAVFIAQLLGVTNIVSAGILTILCIQPSRRKSVEGAWERFAACILAIVFSVIFFKFLGYSPIIVGLLLALFIPTTVFLKIEKGIMTSTVITLNIYALGAIQFSYIKEQFLLIIIGIGTGLLVNLYMPSLDNQLKKLQTEVEDYFQIILCEIASYIRDENLDWKGKEITLTEELLAEASQLVVVDRDNHLFRDNHSYYNYFQMRKKQFELLQQMLPLVARLPKKDVVSELIATYFEKLADSVHPGNTAILFLEELTELRKEIAKKDLPTTQEEFETRASLFQLLHEIEEYLTIKNKFKTSDVKRKRRGRRSKKS